MVLADFIFPELKLPEDLSIFKPSEIKGMKEYIELAKPQKIKTGIFESLDLNIETFHRDLIIDCWHSFTFRSWEEMIEWNRSEQVEYDPHALYKQNYGVCDNYQQILEYLPVETDPRKFIIVLTPIYKKHEPCRYGWRWEKWGEYIGTQKSVADYLYDEPYIDMVYVYHVYEVSV